MEKGDHGQPIQTPFYYGWVVVLIAGFSVFFSGPGQTYSISIFIDYYIQDFDYSRSVVSGIYSAATLVAGITLFMMGRLIDRFGQRTMMVTVSALGPLPFGVFFDWLGGYQEVILLTILFPVTAGILVLLSPQPKYEDYYA
ncbi:hypothetical protein SAMN05192559_11187 [Halobacillus karajensis]|uniref:MFS transporter, metabolite:H+ symporter (MHS) family protein n=1 Tax=Halobacillus karajensis TaxID=195088 RepID=A0A024P9N5_9BACI|nr:MFS transporter, metabolite:H+ symporter (MHS) family protein [Halobacillus karajensis]CDQ25446.1 MFS transporter, metabolite:H+ symporter (MHS) family protein [Halobacillus karajensis]CDQ29023.1 MFS transporter, metabolite:H+ symporter (MHS) family protein [Halobacillus karajensis]SEI09369.1 hypothetical protein SAMN05192559_11187 [Halobacillus karajensis]